MTRGKDRTKKRKVKRTRNTKDRRRGGQDRSKIGSMESIWRNKKGKEDGMEGRGERMEWVISEGKKRMQERKVCLEIMWRNKERKEEKEGERKGMDGNYGEQYGKERRVEQRKEKGWMEIMGSNKERKGEQGGLKKGWMDIMWSNIRKERWMDWNGRG
jgi:hypothetical protein